MFLNWILEIGTIFLKLKFCLRMDNCETELKEAKKYADFSQERIIH